MPATSAVDHTAAKSGVARTVTKPTIDNIDRDVLIANVARIEVRKTQLAIHLKPPTTGEGEDREAERTEVRKDTRGSLLLISWCKSPTRKARELLLPASAERPAIRPIKAERRAALIHSIARGRAWLDEIVSGASTGVEQIAAREKCSVRHVNMTISMAFIAPDLVKAAVEGRLPRGIGVASLRDAPSEWSHQFDRLGLPQPDLRPSTRAILPIPIVWSFRARTGGSRALSSR